jgi:hypothetical protein
VTVKEQVAVLPDGSEAVALTTVVPVGKAYPLGYVDDTVTPQLSEAVKANACTDVHWPGSVKVLMLAGQVMTGF